MHILKETSLKSFHTFGLEINAQCIVEAKSVEDFKHIWSHYSDLPKLVLGEGSNLLFCTDYQGVIVLNRVKGISINESEHNYSLHVGSGEHWHTFVSWCLDNKLYGLENLALIPGFVGSAPIQNIGAYGIEFAEYCEYVDVLYTDTWEVKRLTCAECKFGYRESIFKHELKNKVIVVAVGFKLPKKWEPRIKYGALQQLENKEDLSPQMVFDAVCQIRQDKLPDPRKVGNAGSFFKNPIVKKTHLENLLPEFPDLPYYEQNDYEVKLAAGWLIEQAGFKGKSLGGAAVHDKQALVLVNKDKATPTEVIQLAEKIVLQVLAQFGIELEHEVRFIGRDQETDLAAVCQA